MLIKQLSFSMFCLFLLFLLPSDVMAQKGIITGKITDENFKPLENVSVVIKGTSIGTTTDANGTYSLNVTKPSGNILLFSSIGFTSQQITQSRGNTLDVQLEKSSQALDAVVVVGYGTQKKVNLTGAVSAITAEDLKGRPITSTSSSLQGLLPGVTIRSFTALPGQTGSSIRIRGTGTLGDASPLIVIDGIPGGSMDILNPDDIESISVLKDAASASIYGVRGANGVILVTTKKGRVNGKPNITYSNYVGFQTPTALPEFLGSVDYMILLNESLKNVGKPATYTDSMINIARTGSDPNYYANTNWLKEIYKKRAGQQNHDLSINGGGNNLSYYLSYGYLKQDGLITGNNYGSNRNNLRLRLNTKLIDRLDIDVNLGYIDRKYSESSDDIGEAGGPIYTSLQISPLVPVKFTTGGWGYLGGSRNPVAVSTDGGYNAVPGTRIINTLDSYFTRTCITGCGFTIPALNATKTIDFIAYTPSSKFTVLEHRAIDEKTASDHLPVFSVLRIN